MKKPPQTPLHLCATASLAAALALLSGCAATINEDGIEQRTAQAIGRSAGQFTIGDRTEETGGRINYSVSTRDGAAYRCYLYGATGFQRAMSFGQTVHSDAICTAVVDAQGRGSAPLGNAAGTAAGQPRGADACNALLRKAGRC